MRRLQAANQAGVGPYSDTVSCQMPASAPEAVSGLCVLEQGPSGDYCGDFLPSTCLALRWDEPCCNGAEISSYMLHLGETCHSLDGSATCHVIQQLQPDTEYR